MRIVAGEFKGKPLKMPKGTRFRPTSGKVKEALFSMIDARLPGAVCLDLFAGSGSLGLEAISRGATRCYFCDAAKESLALVRENIARCGAQPRSFLINGPYTKALCALPEKADIIFLDPPYEKKLLMDCIAAISEKNVLAEGGIIVAEHAKDAELPETIGEFSKRKEKKYGNIRLTLYGFAFDS